MQATLRPYVRRKFLLSKIERSFYEVLLDVARDHFVFVKVRLADLIDADERHKDRQTNFWRICSKHIDFVICDSLFRPKIAIELDDSSHEREDRRKRDSDVARLFEAVSFPLLRIPVQSSYDPSEVRQLILTKLLAADI